MIQLLEITIIMPCILTPAFIGIYDSNQQSFL